MGNEREGDVVDKGGCRWMFPWKKIVGGKGFIRGESGWGAREDGFGE